MNVREAKTISMSAADALHVREGTRENAIISVRIAPPLPKQLDLPAVERFQALVSLVPVLFGKRIGCTHRKRSAIGSGTALPGR